MPEVSGCGVSMSGLPETKPLPSAEIPYPMARDRIEPRLAADHGPCGSAGSWVSESESMVP